MMQVQQGEFSSRRFLAALSLILWFGQAVFGEGTLPLQENTASHNFEALAKSAAAGRDAGRTDTAIQDYKSALELRADWAEGWWYLGTLEYSKDRYAEAIPAFQHVVHLAPEGGPGWNFLGLCEFETKDYEKSLEHLKKGLALGDADDPEISRVASYHLALLFVRGGEFEQATRLLGSKFAQGQISPQIRTALGLAMLRVPLLPDEVDPSQDALLQAAGETAAIANQGDAAKVTESFRALSKAYPRIPYVHYEYGRALAAAARYEEALGEQHEEETVSPKNALPRIATSQLQLRLQHIQEAVRAAEDAVRLAPDSSAAHNALGQALLASGKRGKAAEEFAAAEKFALEKPLWDEQNIRFYSRQTAPDGIGHPQVTGGNPNQATEGQFEELSRRAAVAQTAGQTDQAIQIYQQALGLRPGWDDGRWNLAMICYTSGKYSEAISALKSWVERKPNFGTAWAVMGLSEFEIKDYGNALIHLQRGEQLGLGGSADAVRFAKYHLGLLLVHDGQFENATRTLTPEAGTGALAKQIEFVLGMALLHMPLFPEQVEASKRSLVQTAGGIAMLLQGSKYDEAFTKFELLLKENSVTPFLHYAYGTALASLSKYEEAETQFRQELKISPGSELPYLRLASLQLKKHRPAEAMPLAQRAVQLSAVSAEAHYLWGRASFELGQEEIALRELETASKLAPGSPEVHFNLAKAYAKAKLEEKAHQERTIFTRLSALAEEQRSHSANQAYSGAQNAAEFAPTRSEAEKTAKPEHPL